MYEIVRNDFKVHTFVVNCSLYALIYVPGQLVRWEGGTLTRSFQIV
jgi:hypothetical protein